MKFGEALKKGVGVLGKEKGGILKEANRRPLMVRMGGGGGGLRG